MGPGSHRGPGKDRAGAGQGLGRGWVPRRERIPSEGLATGQGRVLGRGRAGAGPGLGIGKRPEPAGEAPSGPPHPQPRRAARSPPLRERLGTYRGETPGKSAERDPGKVQLRLLPAGERTGWREEGWGPAARTGEMSPLPKAAVRLIIIGKSRHLQNEQRMRAHVCVCVCASVCVCLCPRVSPAR